MGEGVNQDQTLIPLVVIIIGIDLLPNDTDHEHHGGLFELPRLCVSQIGWLNQGIQSSKPTYSILTSLFLGGVGG
jgi:hypothetical protein